MNLNEVKKTYGKYVFQFMQMAEQIDEASNNMIDSYMCTERLCPCLDYNVSYDGLSTTKKLFNDIDSHKLA